MSSILMLLAIPSSGIARQATGPVILSEANTTTLTKEDTTRLRGDILTSLGMIGIGSILPIEDQTRTIQGIGFKGKEGDRTTILRG